MILLIMLVILLSIYSVGISICYKKNEAGIEQQIMKLWAEKEELELLVNKLKKELSYYEHENASSSTPYME